MFEFKPDLVIIFQSSHKLLGKYNKLNPEKHTLLATNELAAIDTMYSNITNHLSAKVIYYNYTEIDDSIFGNYANKTESSFLFQLRKLNYELMVMPLKNRIYIYVIFLLLQNQVGKIKLFSALHIY